jgi:hypothetical protein
VRRLGALVAVVISACSTDPGRATFYEQNAQPAPPPVADAIDSGPLDAFFGSEKFEGGHIGTVDSTLAPTHLNGNPGVDCQVCHASPTDAKTPKWIASGTVYTSKAGTTAVAEGAEVRINDAAGNKVASAYTDKVGNFVFDGAALPAGIPANSHVAVRNATSKNPMGSTPGGACNSAGCHAQGSAYGRVSVSPN